MLSSLCLCLTFYVFVSFELFFLKKRWLRVHGRTQLLDDQKMGAIGVSLFWKNR